MGFMALKQNNILGLYSISAVLYLAVRSVAALSTTRPTDVAETRETKMSHSLDKARRYNYTGWAKKSEPQMLYT